MKDHDRRSSVSIVVGYLMRSRLAASIAATICADQPQPSLASQASRSSTHSRPPQDQGPPNQPGVGPLAIYRCVTPRYLSLRAGFSNPSCTLTGCSDDGWPNVRARVPRSTWRGRKPRSPDQWPTTGLSAGQEISGLLRRESAIQG